MMQHRLCKILFLTALLSLPSIATAAFHLWEINELYSNPDGSVQYVEFVNPTNDADEHLLTLSALVSIGLTPSGFVQHNYDFPEILSQSISTAQRSFLVGTTGFSALGVVTPDYIIPDNFLFVSGGRLELVGADVYIHGALPLDPLGILSLNADGSTGINSPTNFSGISGSISAVPLPAAAWLFASGMLALSGLAKSKK